ncbi:hypothetical protein GCM10023143_25290 [Compostibacter hankyongensis]|uniref:Tox-REase-9 domain-containing protein n=2 Tax=Compostibacter hankyongensis TaxID=1007089 RepID=A0ABP8FZT6_9BACT
MHKSYEIGAEGIKEFRLPSGRRIDFLDIKNSTIYELKPFNPRAIEEGFQTLGQTRAGRNLARMTEGMPYYGPINGQPASQAWQWWARLSKTYANGIPKKYL